MATAVFKHEGSYIDYTPDSDVSAGDVVVQEDLVGVATSDIDSGVKDALRVDGVFAFPKASDTSSALSAGTKVYWDAENEQATDTEGENKYLGKVTNDAAASDTTVWVRLGQD